jgi:hypothetical protein
MFSDVSEHPTVCIFEVNLKIRPEHSFEMSVAITQTRRSHNQKVNNLNRCRVENFTPRIREGIIISGTGAAIWSKTNFGPIGHHHPRSSPLPRLCTVPSASGILEVVFCECIQHSLRFCLYHLSCVELSPFQF